MSMRGFVSRGSLAKAAHRVRLKVSWSRSRWIRAASLVCFGLLALLYAKPAHAVWEGASSGSSAYVPGNTYDFDATTNSVGGNIDYSFSGFTLTGNLVLNLDNAVATDAGGRTITLGGGAGVSLNLGTVNRNFTVGTGDTLVVANAIANTTGGITKNGAGVLQLNAANLSTGLTQVDAGELRWNIANALSSGDLTVNNGGTANISTFSDTVGTVTLNQGGLIAISSGTLTTGTGGLIANNGGSISVVTGSTGAIALGGNLTYSDTIDGSTTLGIARIVLGSNVTRTFHVADGDDASGIDLDITGFLGNTTSGTANLVKNGAGTMQLGGSAANSGRSGGTTSINDGILLLNKSASVDAIGGTGLITVGDGTGLAGTGSNGATTLRAGTTRVTNTAGLGTSAVTMNTAANTLQLWNNGAGNDGTVTYGNNLTDGFSGGTVDVNNNGSEFTARCVREWLVRVGVKTLYIEPGSPWENGYVESFNGKLRDELLKRESFDTLLEAKVLIERWRQAYNTVRPHSALGYRPPAPEARQPCAAASAAPQRPHRAGLSEGESLT